MRRTLKTKPRYQQLARDLKLLTTGSKLAKLAAPEPAPEPAPVRTAPAPPQRAPIQWSVHDAADLAPFLVSRVGAEQTPLYVIPPNVTVIVCALLPPCMIVLQPAATPSQLGASLQAANPLLLAQARAYLPFFLP